jgi:2-oxoglutarate dehydrogenase E2 component (dihydrolipoamide succinyltransferase)
MPTEIKVPAVGESITEVFVGEWYVKDGDRVDLDQDLVGLESDKATFDVPAPAAGIVKITVKAGEEAEIGDVLGRIEDADGDDQADDSSSSRSKQGDSDTTSKRESKDSAKKPQQSEKSHEPKSAKPKDSRDEDEPADDDPHVMPAARRLLEEHGLSKRDVKATGPGGRLLKEDVLRHVEQQGSQGEGKMGGEKERADDELAAGPRSEEVVNLSPIRRRIAERLVEAQQTAALLTTFNDVDMSAVMQLRKRFQETFVEEHEVKLGFMSFFVKAAVDALKRFPAVNAEIRGKTAVYKNYFDIGVAIGGGKGLVVPVLRNAERLSFAEIEEAINDFGARARKNDIRLEELEGGTFTISNGGVYGSLLSTPIVNPPQSGVLGMHRIEQRPVAVDGQVVIRPMMYLALTYDHRLVDGREAVQFLVRIKECIEDPTRMILEV